MSLVSILQRQHQALPEWGGTPEVQAFTSKLCLHIWCYSMLFLTLVGRAGEKSSAEEESKWNIRCWGAGWGGWIVARCRNTMGMEWRWGAVGETNPRSLSRTSTAEWRTCCSQDERETVLRALEESRSVPTTSPCSVWDTHRNCVSNCMLESQLPNRVRCTSCAWWSGWSPCSVQGGLTQIFSHDRSTWVAPRFPSGYLVVEVDRRCVLNCTAISDPAPIMFSR